MYCVDMIKIKYVVLSIICLISLGSFYFTERLTQTVEENVVYIFADVATGSTILEMAQFVQLPQSSRKFVAWGSYPNLGDKLQTHNAVQIPFTTTPYNQLVFSIQAGLKKTVQQLLVANPNTQFVFHTNMFHARTLLFPILKKIPKEQIKHIYLYEDGYGNTVASLKERILQHVTPERPHSVWDIAYPYYTHFTYPTTYYLAYPEEIRQNAEFKQLANILRNADVQPVDFYEIKANLTRKQKSVLKHLLDFNDAYFRDLLQKSGKKTVILLGGRPMNSKERQAFQVLNEKILANSSYTFIFKPHPHPASESLAEELKKKHKDLAIIPRSIPMEAFLLFDVVPDYIAGYSSSVFLTFNTNFIMYIKRPNDTYLPFLLKKGIIKPFDVIPLIPDSN